MPIRNLLAAFFAIVAGFVFSACGDDDGNGGAAPQAVIAYDLAALQAGNLGHGCLDPDVDAHVAELVAEMTLAEKISQMHGEGLNAGVSTTLPTERLGIPGFRMADGPRGAMPGPGTTMPVGIARGATWDPALERRVGEVMGTEAKAKGLDILLAPTIEPVRHPRWGRTQETYGEDPLLVARMGASFIGGVQQHVLASAKHFAANNIENTRFSVSANMDERTLREIYLPAFRSAVIDAGVGSVMSAYNRVNGSFCSENEHLLRDILKGDWGFKGFVESDWVIGTRSTVPAANGGLDLEMPSPIYFGNRLMSAVDNGDVDESVIDEAVGRTLRQKLCFGVRPGFELDPEAIETPQHIEVALEVARKGIVLLENDGSLPLDAQALVSVAVVGALADFENLGDFGSSRIAPSDPSTTILDGVRQAGPSATIHHIDADVLADEDAAAIAAADAAIVVVGNTFRDEGENLTVLDPETDEQIEVGDRESLDLEPAHEALIREVAQLNPKTIVILEGSGPFLMSTWVDDVAGLLTAWYPGMRGGQAVAEIVFGEVNPSGKLPLTFPVSDDQLPPFDNRSREVTFDAYHGYRLVDRDGAVPQFPFGFGLSYTTFEYSDLQISPSTLAAADSAEVSVNVTNSGDRAGDEVVQLYVGYSGSEVERPVKELKGFGRVSLEPGETKRLIMEISAEQLAYFDIVTNAWKVEALEATVMVGASSRDLRLEGTLRVQP